MNYIKELMLDYDLTEEEAQDYLEQMADEAKDRAKYGDM